MLALLTNNVVSNRIKMKEKNKNYIIHYYIVFVIINKSICV